ncbi:40S ribosomal protein S12 [Forsythia ovata]|uniref:40S ribosomal protein S12 n=1 Tax=Forsythia ovata TaxID=205694 RepID=A0ABD1QRB7_9LAMI
MPISSYDRDVWCYFLRVQPFRVQAEGPTSNSYKNHRHVHLLPNYIPILRPGCYSTSRLEASKFYLKPGKCPETPVPALSEPMDIMTALQLVLKKSKAHGGLDQGFCESAKVIEKHAAQLCVLAEDCDQSDYVKLIASEGKARKVVGCSCVVVKDYGEESERLHIVQEYVKVPLDGRRMNTS